MLCELLLKQLNELRVNNVHCDLELVAKDNTSFHVHRIVLTALNQRHFQQALKKTVRQVKPATHSKMFLSLVLGEELEILVEFMYGAVIKKQSKYDILVSALAKLDMTYLLEEAGVFVLENDYVKAVKTEVDDTLENPASVTDNNPIIPIERQCLTSQDRTSERSTENVVTNSIHVKKEPGLPDSDSHANDSVIDTNTSTKVIAKNLQVEPGLPNTDSNLNVNNIDTNTNTGGSSENFEADTTKTVRNVLETSEVHSTGEILREVKVEVNENTECQNIPRIASKLDKVNETLRNSINAEDNVNDSDVGEVKYSEMSPFRVNDVHNRDRPAQSTDAHNSAKQSMDTVNDTSLPKISEDDSTNSKENNNLSPSKKLRPLLPVPSVYLVPASVASKMSPTLENTIPRTGMTSVLVTISKPKTVVQPSVLISREKASSELTIIKKSNMSRHTTTSFPALLFSTPDSSAIGSKKQTFSLLSDRKSSTSPNTSLAAGLGVRVSIPNSMIPSFVQVSKAQTCSAVSSNAMISSPGILVSTPKTVISPYVSSTTILPDSTLPSVIPTVTSNTTVSSGIPVSTPKSVLLPYMPISTIRTYPQVMSTRTLEMPTAIDKQVVSTLSSGVTTEDLSLYVPSSTVHTCSPLMSARTSDIPITSEIALVSTSSGIAASVFSPYMPSSRVQTCSTLISTPSSDIPTTSELSVSTGCAGITDYEPIPKMEPCVTVLSPRGSTLYSSVTKHIMCEGERFDNGTEKQRGTFQFQTQESLKSARRKPLFKKPKKTVKKYSKINASVVNILDDEAEPLELNRPKSPAFEKDDGTHSNDLQETEVLVESAAAFLKISNVAVIKKEDDDIVSSGLNMATTAGDILDENAVSSDLTATAKGQISNHKVSSDLPKAIRDNLNDKPVSSDLTPASTIKNILNDTVSSDLVTAAAVGDSLNVNTVNSDLTLSSAVGNTVNDEGVTSEINKASAIGKTLNDSVGSHLTSATTVRETFNDKTVSTELTKVTAIGETLKDDTVSSDLAKATTLGGTLNDHTASKERDEQPSESDERPKENFTTTFNDSETPIKSSSNRCIIPSSEILKLTPDDIVAVKRKKEANLVSIKKMKSLGVVKKVDIPRTLTKTTKKITKTTKKTVDTGSLGKIESVQKSCQVSLVKISENSAEIDMKSVLVDEDVGKIESIHKSNEFSTIDKKSGCQNEKHNNSVELENKRRKTEMRPCAVFFEKDQSEQSDVLELDVTVNRFGINGEMNAKSTETNAKSAETNAKSAEIKAKPDQINDENCKDTADEIEERCVEMKEIIKAKKFDKTDFDNEHGSEVCCTGNDISSEVLKSSMFIWEERHTVQDIDKKTNLNANFQQRDSMSEPVVNQDSLQQSNEDCPNDTQKECRVVRNTAAVNELFDIHTETELNEGNNSADILSDEIEEIDMHSTSIIDRDMDCSKTLSDEKGALKESNSEETNSLFQVQSKSIVDPRNEKFQPSVITVQSSNNTNSNICSVRTEPSQCREVPTTTNLVPMMSTLSPNITRMTRPKPFTKAPNILPKLPITMVRFPLSLRVTGPSNKLSLCQIDAPVITSSFVYPNQKFGDKIDNECETRKRKESGSEEKRKRHKSEPGNISSEKGKQFKKLKSSENKELISEKRPVSFKKDSKRKKSKATKKSSVVKKKMRNDISVEWDSENEEVEVVKSTEHFLSRLEQTDSDVDVDVPLSELKERMNAAHLSSFEKDQMSVTVHRTTRIDSKDEVSSHIVCKLKNENTMNEEEKSKTCDVENQAESLEVSETVGNSDNTQQGCDRYSIDELRSQLKLMRANIKLPYTKNIANTDSEKCNTVFEISGSESFMNIENNEETVLGGSRQNTEEKNVDSVDCEEYHGNKEIAESNDENEIGDFLLAIDKELKNCVKNERNSIASVSCSNNTNDHSEDKNEEEHIHDETKADKSDMIVDLTMQEDETNVFSFGIPGVIQEKGSETCLFSGSSPALRKALMSPVSTESLDKSIHCNRCYANGVTYSLDSQTRLCRKCLIRHQKQRDNIRKNSKNISLQKKKVEFDYREHKIKLQENINIEKAKRTKTKLLRKRAGLFKATLSVTAPAYNKPALTTSERTQSPTASNKNCFEAKEDKFKNDLKEKRTEVVVSESLSTTVTSSVCLSRPPVVPNLTLSPGSLAIASKKPLPASYVFHETSPVLSSQRFPAIKPKVEPAVQLYTPVLLSRPIMSCSLTSAAVSVSPVLSPCHMDSTSVVRGSNSSSLVMSPQSVESSVATAWPILPTTSGLLSVDRGSSSALLIRSPQTITSLVSRAVPVLPSTVASLSDARGSNSESLVMSSGTFESSVARAKPVLPSTIASVSVMSPQTVASSVTRSFSVLPSTAKSSSAARESNRMSLVMSPQTVTSSVVRASPKPVLPPHTIASSGSTVSNMASPKSVLASMLASQPLAPVPSAAVLIFKSPGVTLKNEDFLGHGDTGAGYRNIQPNPD
ncbi:uncharacterized protein LOC123540812 [Mercenaria mercenaria]|uniref:uncharacterized protein LOC123540812 n=1 Tax=Mercenaria mercenaria TaxID=6596 RepID=UPI00234E6A6D|nr:uncharacterized protein LOC123540812 [Mercenaria mercenaria]